MRPPLRPASRTVIPPNSGSRSERRPADRPVDIFHFDAAPRRDCLLVRWVFLVAISSLIPRIVAKSPRTQNLWTPAGTASTQPRIRRKQRRPAPPVRHPTVNERKLGRLAPRCKRATFCNCSGNVSGPSGQLGDSLGNGHLQVVQAPFGGNLAGACLPVSLTKVEGVGRAVPFRGDPSDFDGRACPVQRIRDGVK